MNTHPRRGGGLSPVAAGGCGWAAATARAVGLVILGAIPGLLEGLAHGQDRPGMRQLSPGADLPLPPSARELVDARAALKARFREPLSHTDSAAGARQAAALLLEASLDEPDKGLKWLMLDEARRLGVAAGNADVVSRAVTLASAVFMVDEQAVELRALEEIPLRAIDSARASRLAEAAERVATRAATDGRRDLADDAWTLAFKAWQRAGNGAAAKQAAERAAGR